MAKQRSKDENFSAWWRALRDPLSFLLGSGVVIYEMVVEHADQKLVLGLAAALLGLPVAAWAGKRLDRRGDGE